jgi:hypothetical protein
LVIGYWLLVIGYCVECESQYYRNKKKMAELCPECSYILYGYENCTHNFDNGRCLNCYWDGSVPDYVNGLKQSNKKQNNGKYKWCDTNKSSNR